MVSFLVLRFVYFLLIVLSLVVSTSAVDCLERLVSEMIYQSINQSISKLITRRNLSIRQLRGVEYQWSSETMN